MAITMDVYRQDRGKSTIEPSNSASMALASKHQIPVTAIYGNEANPTLGDQPEPAVQLANLNLIDTGKITREQIFELRKDEDSVARLRRLQAFWGVNYTDKSENQIREDLHQRVDAYEERAKSWGFDTVLSSASTLLSDSPSCSKYLSMCFSTRAM